MSASSFRIYVTDFISSIYNLKTVFRADFINFQICTLSKLRLASYLIFIDPNHSYLSQLDVTYKTPDLMSHFLPP
ncbi:hypothetical protein RKT58_06990, partial [Streptococcus pneumoniae]|nr:hypothetical protein [Streptococcus pneumoniae]MDS2458245.1 hypothetical protein [Streptococcus pneumoniae]MDS2687094.1 hypothetical protein [Streptococcus pneumoniae]MDS3052406.1 hypothetical protein [Streptococcus pneumoniae]MDS8299138.1 hypothetical protein [Streptococcus pneumoniae]